ncbi:MAG: endonuclease domain-containing protein [Pseudomonadota bacterium]|nr:endonuclease domain-containing protein [Pseudomonadota bacterium]
MADLKFVARRLRKDATNAERRLWAGLRRKAVDGFRFRRQVPIEGFVCDFVCLEARLIVEVDGATDATREAALRAQGFHLLRVSNDDVYGNVEGVLETIRLKLNERRSSGSSRTRAAPSVPSPLAGEG